MTRFFQRGRVAALFVAVAACGGASRPPAVGSAPEPVRTTGIVIAPAGHSTAALGRYEHTPADAHFMAGMIPHHAQAILIAGWAPTHEAGAAVRTLCERIVVAQRDEITTMQSWLRARNETVPDSNATHLKMTMNGMQHDMLMPGMLNADELARLDKARGAEFDRLFLTFMIRHHEGALTMVEALFASSGAAQDETIFKLASDIFADQSTEIERMEKMIAAMNR